MLFLHHRQVQRRYRNHSKIEVVATNSDTLAIMLSKKKSSVHNISHRTGSSWSLARNELFIPMLNLYSHQENIPSICVSKIGIIKDEMRSKVVVVASISCIYLRAYAPFAREVVGVEDTTRQAESPNSWMRRDAQMPNHLYQETAVVILAS